VNLPNPQKEAEKARQVLKDAITASGVPQHVAVALWCAADGYARTTAREIHRQKCEVCAKAEWEQDCARIAGAVERGMTSGAETV